MRRLRMVGCSSTVACTRQPVGFCRVLLRVCVCVCVRIELFFDRFLRKATNRALSRACLVSPDSQEGSLEHHAEETLAAIAPRALLSSTVTETAVRPVTAAARPAARSRSQVRDLSSSSPPPATSPSKVPKEWCRACWDSARQKRFNIKHDCGSEGRRCKFETDRDGRPD